LFGQKKFSPPFFSVKIELQIEALPDFRAASAARTG